MEKLERGFRIDVKKDENSLFLPSLEVLEDVYLDYFKSMFYIPFCIYIYYIYKYIFNILRYEKIFIIVILVSAKNKSIPPSAVHKLVEFETS